MGRREEHKQRLRQEIRDTALRLFHERGFDETRVHDVIALVGISEKTFFNYFASKQAVLETSAIEMVEAYQALLEYELTCAERPVLQRLAEIVELWAQSFAGDRQFLATVTTRTPAFFGASGPLADQQKTTQRLLADLLRQGQMRGELRIGPDPLQLAELLTAAMLLTTINWLGQWWEDSHDALTDRLGHALDIFLNGAVASPAEVLPQTAPVANQPPGD
jgi:AcrR family transcriptional regulator